MESVAFCGVMAEGEQVAHPKFFLGWKIGRKAFSCSKIVIKKSKIWGSLETKLDFEHL